MVQLSLQQAVNAAAAHLSAGRASQAVSLFRQILAVQPDHPGVLVNLGIALHAAGELNDSLTTFEHLTRLQPAWPDGWNNLGVVLRDLNRLEEAVSAFRKAIEFQPDFPAALDNLGAVLQDLGRPEEAIAMHLRSISVCSNSANAHSNLANALKFSGRIDEAIATYRRALALAPNDPVIHHYLGLTFLLAGDYQQGLAEHEWRCRIKHPQQICQNFQQPRWDGGPLNGRRIFLHAEQGLGDTIQFVRYLPLVAARGGTTLLQCQPELCRLMQDSMNVVRVVSSSETLPAFDVHCPLMSLPYVFKTTAGTIPAPPRYLQSDVQRLARWNQRIDEHPARLKVGLAWAGKKTYSDDRQRSLALSMLATLADVADARFFSLQKGPAAIEGRHTTVRLHVTDWTDELCDFAETAALIESLDLVISVDTAVAHLAGAMGKPVWVLLPFVPDWRWMTGRTDSAWYPSARLFRQPKAGDWNTPIQAVTQALLELARGR